MGGTTPIMALPYPTGTDRVADGDNAIQALAERVEAIEAGGWIAMTLMGGWSQYGPPGEPAAYRKVGDRVEVRGFIRSDNGSAAGNWVWSIPAPYRPAYEFNSGVFAVTNTNAFRGMRVAITLPPNGNANYLTVEYDQTPLAAGSTLCLTGLTWFVSASPLGATTKPGPDGPDTPQPKEASDD